MDVETALLVCSSPHLRILYKHTYSKQDGKGKASSSDENKAEHSLLSLDLERQPPSDDRQLFQLNVIGPIYYYLYDLP
jgi:hypothetical protein